jgi:hypothetical protein
MMVTGMKGRGLLGGNSKSSGAGQTKEAEEVGVGVTGEPLFSVLWEFKLRLPRGHSFQRSWKPAVFQEVPWRDLLPREKTCWA